jgi:hypothetical protein
VEASSVADLVERALPALRSDRPDAVLVTADRGPLMIGRTRIAEFLTTNRLPAIYSFYERGGLMAYTANYHATYRRNVAHVIDKIFKGTKAGDLPVQQPTDLESQDHKGDWPHNAADSPFARRPGNRMSAADWCMAPFETCRCPVAARA